jgi:hypothetical protein
MIKIIREALRQGEGRQCHQYDCLMIAAEAFRARSSSGAKIGGMTRSMPARPTMAGSERHACPNSRADDQQLERLGPEWRPSGCGGGAG